MGKAINPYPTGHFRLYKTNRAKEGQPLVVQMEYTYKSVAIRRSTGVTVKEKDWNPKENNGRGGLKASYGPDYRNIKTVYLKKYRNLIQRFGNGLKLIPDNLP